MGSKQLVLAFFPNEMTADDAVRAIKAWDKADKDVKLGAIGILVKDYNGKVKTHKLGKRRTGGGAILFAVAGMLSGGLTVLGGAVLGGIVGSFFRKGLGLSKEDLARIDSELDGGKAAVGILAKADEAAAVAAKLAELGGVPETHEVTEEAEAHATEAAEEAAEAEDAPEAEAAPAAAADESTEQPAA